MEGKNFRSAHAQNLKLVLVVVLVLQSEGHHYSFVFVLISSFEFVCANKASEDDYCSIKTKGWLLERPFMNTVYAMSSYFVASQYQHDLLIRQFSNDCQK